MNPEAPDRPLPPPPQKVACVILARGGSVGIPGKNLQHVGGLALVARSVRAARDASSVGWVYVSTDDDAIAAEAKAHGAEVIARPADLSGAAASSEDGWLHALDHITKHHQTPSQMVFLQCTSPFTTGADIDGCLGEMTAKGAQCALSVTEDHSFLWTVDAQGFGTGVNHAEAEQRQRRQDLPPQFRESGAIYCVDVSAFREVKRRFCGKVAVYQVDHPPLEIDTPDDLELCRRIASAGSPPTIPAGRLKRVQAVAMDFDGVHTDNLVHTDQDGRETVATSRGDGMGIALLRDARALPMIIMSKERNPVVLARAKKLGLEVQNSVDDKVTALGSWLAEQGLDWDALLYIGNDLNDIPALEKAGLSVCPADAHPSVAHISDWVLTADGGRGAIREMCDALIAIAD